MVDTLVGDESSNPYSMLGGLLGWDLNDRESILAYAKSGNKFQILEAVHLHILFVSFWMEDYVEAEKPLQYSCLSQAQKFPVYIWCMFHSSGGSLPSVFIETAKEKNG